MCLKQFFKKKNMRKKLIRDECVICLGIIMRNHQQCPHCERYMHETCLLRWESHCISKKLPITCPICRWEYK